MNLSNLYSPSLELTQKSGKTPNPSLHSKSLSTKRVFTKKISILEFGRT